MRKLPVTKVDLLAIKPNFGPWRNTFKSNAIVDLRRSIVVVRNIKYDTFSSFGRKKAVEAYQSWNGLIQNRGLLRADASNKTLSTPVTTPSRVGVYFGDCCHLLGISSGGNDGCNIGHLARATDGMHPYLLVGDQSCCLLHCPFPSQREGFL